MPIQEHSTRIFYVTGETTIDEIISNENKTTPTDKGRCYFAARIEVAKQGSPELKGQEVYLHVRNKYCMQVWQKGHGGGERGWVGPVLTFGDLIEKTRAPPGRNDGKHLGQEITYEYIKKSISQIFEDRPHHVQIEVATEYSARENYHINKPNYQITLRPVIVQACKEVADHLNSEKR